MPEGDQAEGRFEDLFEDLDKFFAPIEQVDRPLRDPLPGPSGSSAGAPGPPPPVEAPRKPEAGSEREIVSPAAAATDDREPDATDLPPGEPPLGSRDEGPAGPDWMYGVVEDESEMQMESQPAPLPEPEMPAGEMTGEDWSRLRDVLGDEAQGEEIEFAAASSEPPLDSEEEQHELTLDDLKKAPPEYRDLPGPTGHDVEAGAGAPTGEDARAAWGRGAEEGAEESATEETAAGEPTMAEVEAAADQLAEEFRGPEGARAPEGARPGQQAEPGEPTEYAEPAQGPMEPAEVEKQLLADLEEGGGPRTVRVGAAESLTGPTWEEPTSRPVMAEPTIPPGPGQARDMTAAVMTAAGLAAIGLISLLIAKWLFAIVATGVVVIGQMELYGTMHRRGHQPATALGLAVGALVMAAAYLKGEATMTFFLVLGLFLSFLWYMAAPLKARENLIRNVGATMLGVLYVPFLAGYVLLLLSQKNSGRALMVTVIALAFVYDIAAYFFGSFWGSRALAPTISPRKSWEGLLGATAVTLALSVALIPSAVDYLTVVRAIGLAVVIIVFAPLGDLVESLIKRDLGVKDMGSILPGHGGILDRIDSVLLVAPAAFYYLRLIF